MESFIFSSNTGLLMLKIFTRSFYSYSLFFLVFLLLNVLAVQAQTTITQWNFNNSSLVPSTGVGTLSLLSPVTSSYLTTGSEGGAGDKSLSTTNYPLSGSTAKMAGIELSVSTTGYNGIHLKYFRRHTGTAARKVVIQFFNGTIWQDFYSYTVSTVNSFSPQINVDFSGVTFINNNSSVKFRIVTDTSNGNNYEPTNTSGTYGSLGAIHYDLITITGNTLSCIGPATQQASGLRLLKTNANSAQFTLNRGDGGGCLVLCSNTGIPSAPANNTIYIANAAFTSGAAVGNGYAVYNTQVSNPAIQYFNITSLAAGTKYYLAAYEYSDSGSCYLAPAFVDSFYCNSTVLYPGDVQFVGYDNNVISGGDDAFAIASLAPLSTGTTFQIVNSRYEAGAAADTRTNRWYAGGNAIYQDLQKIKILYTGSATLAAGSIISFDFKAPTGYNVRINGFPSSSVSVISENIITGNSMLVAPGAEQFFITQGRFTSYGTSGVNQYSLLDGHVLHGITYTNNWVGFSTSPSTGTTIADRQSRIPADIEGMHLFFSVGDFAYYNPVSVHNGTQNSLLVAINNNAATWTFGTDAGTNQINAFVSSSFFTPNRLTAAGTWTGNANDNNWFNRLNWEGLFVPDSLTDVNIPAGKAPQIDSNAQFATMYNKVATTQALTINGRVILSGNGADKLVIYDSLFVDSTGRFSALAGQDTIVVRGNLQRRDGSALQEAFTNSHLNLEGNRLGRTIDIWLITGTPFFDVRILAINNLPGVRITNGGIQTVKQLELTNGVLSIVENFARYSLGQSCSIVSPINFFGELNKGWEKSFIDGRVNITTNAAIPYTAPVGNAIKNIFAPLVFEPDNSNLRTYSASYTPSSHPNVDSVDVANPPFDHVSKLEYWTLNSSNQNAAAKITLYYTPYSRVGGGGNADTALMDLRIGQYWDSLGTGGIKWRPYSSSGFYSLAPSPNINFGRISYSAFATDLRLFGIGQNFTLATISCYNTLPIQLLTWKATPQSKQVRLNWQVADESDVNFYNIEKSTDGVHYFTLQKISKAIASNSYIIYDSKPADGWNYYRLKATGTDGKTFNSDIQKVWFAAAGQWLVYPNPATDVLWMQLPVAGTITLYTMEGKIMLQRKLPASLNRLPVQSLAKGIYLLEYFDGKKKQSQKINLQ